MSMNRVTCKCTGQVWVTQGGEGKRERETSPFGAHAICCSPWQLLDPHGHVLPDGSVPECLGKVHHLVCQGDREALYSSGIILV